MKELFIQCHEELITEYFEQHPTANEREAQDNTAAAAYRLMQDKYADMIDAARERAKEIR